MKKAKRHLQNFVNHLFGIYKVPRIPVYIHWHHPSVVNADGLCGFGVFCYGDDEKPCIHIACEKIGKNGAHSVFAHEFVHYLQYLHGFDMDNVEESERAADYFGAALYGQWIISKTDKQTRIDGLLNAWEKAPEHEEQTKEK